MTNFYNVKFFADGKFETYTIAALNDANAYAEIPVIGSRLISRFGRNAVQFISITRA